MKIIDNINSLLGVWGRIEGLYQIDPCPGCQRTFKNRPRAETQIC
jgi:hypothetical protein